MIRFAASTNTACSLLDCLFASVLLSLGYVCCAFRMHTSMLIFVFSEVYVNGISCLSRCVRSGCISYPYRGRRTGPVPGSGADTHHIRCWYPPYQVLIPTVSGTDTHHIRCRYSPSPRPISVGDAPATSGLGFGLLPVKGRAPSLMGLGVASHTESDFRVRFPIFVNAVKYQTTYTGTPTSSNVSRAPVRTSPSLLNCARTSSRYKPSARVGTRNTSWPGLFFCTAVTFILAPPASAMK